MQEVFEKIIEKLNSKKAYFQRFYECEGKSEHDADLNKSTQLAFDDAIEIVKQEAEKFGTDTNVGSNGWIPVSERLPEGRQDVLVCFDNIDGCIIAWYAPNGRTWRNSSTDNICKAEPIAWMNLPTPSQSKGE